MRISEYSTYTGFTSLFVLSYFLPYLYNLTYATSVFHLFCQCSSPTSLVSEIRPRSRGFDHETSFFVAATKRAATKPVFITAKKRVATKLVFLNATKPVATKRVFFAATKRVGTKRVFFSATKRVATKRVLFYRHETSCHETSFFFVRK